MHPLTCLILGLSLMGVTQGQLSSSSNLSAFLNLMTALKYDAPCSWEYEESRQNLTRTLSTMSTSNRLGSYAIVSLMNRFSTDVVANRKRFCAAPELLICSKDTLRCGCGDPGKEVVFPGSDSSRDYVVERDEAGVNRCRWNEDTYCLSDDLLRAQGFGTMINSKCRSGTKCISKGSGEECSFASVITHVMTSMRRSGRGGSLNLQTIMRDMYQGKVCTCRPDPALNTVHSEEEGFWSAESNDIRRKRSIGGHLTVLEEVASHQGEEQRMMGLVAPALDVQAFLG